MSKSFKKRAAATIVEGIASAVVPAGGIPVALLKEYWDHKQKEAQEIIMNEIGQGRLEKLNNEQQRDFIPIGYRFMESVRKGAAKRNLQILARIISNMIDSHTINPIKFNVIEDSLSDLTFDELIVLSSYVRNYDMYMNALKVENGINGIFNIEGKTHKVALTHSRKLRSKVFYYSCCNVLSSKRWLSIYSFNMLSDINNGLNFIPTKLVGDIKNISLDDILFRQG